jgi:hypothetical protein
MSRWLAAALAQVASAEMAERVPLVPIVPKSQDGAGFGTIGTIGTAERAAGAPTEGLPFGIELATLRAANPTGDDRRWRQACSDASRFLRNWGEEARALGWTADDLFGLHPIAPLARYDAMGLVWLLCGQPVAAITEAEALLQNGLRFRRAGKLTPHSNPNDLTQLWRRSLCLPLTRADSTSRKSTTAASPSRPRSGATVTAGIASRA